MNRKGDAGDMTMFFVFFFLMVIVLTGLWIGVFAFFGNGYDFRKAEAETLAYKLEQCFNNNPEGILMRDFSEKLKDLCQFNDNVQKERVVYVRDINSGEEWFVGVLDYKNQCFFEGSKGNTNFPQCVKFEMDFNGRSLEIITGSGEGERRVAT